MSQKRKLTSYTIEQRYKVLTLLDKGEKASKIAKEYGIPKNNISTWNKPENREKIVKEYEAWRAVTSGTIANCFRKGGFVQGQ